MRENHWLILVVMLVLMVALIFPAYAQPPSKPTIITKRIRLATLPPGSSAYALMVSMSQTINRYSDIFSSIIPTTSPGGFYELLKAGKADIIMPQSINAWHNWTGKGGGEWTGLFPDPKVAIKSMRLLMGVSNTYYGFVTGTFTGITSIPELRGKKIGRLYPTMPATNYSAAELRAYGLDPEKDVTSFKYAFTTDALIDLGQKRIDAAYTSMGGAKILELATNIGVVWLPFDPGKISYLKKLEPLIEVGTVGTYIPGIKKEMPAMYVRNYLVCNNDLSEEVAYKVAKAVCDHIQELVAVAWELKEWGKERAIVPEFFMPYHPGAIKYYKEIGIWTANAEARQQRLLAELRK